MVWIPGGTFWMGSNEFDDAKPVHKVYVDGYWMDKTEVTNAQFEKFVKATGYVTVAEKPPDLAALLKQQPAGTPPPPKENLIPGSLVFAAPSAPVPLDDPLRWWRWTQGASWRHPEGPASDLKGRENHPVVHVGYADALAYCKWRSQKEGGTFRLPTEAEWEFAARGGLDRKTFCWGGEPRPQGKPMANTWQGEFPNHNTLEDGFAGTAPVGSFAPNGYSLCDMSGNVWEWCADWYHFNYYKFSPNRNPPGPASSYDPSAPKVAKRVRRGGSFLCCDNYCKRYVPGARGQCEPESTTNHTGFRCVRSAP
jgi:formylglycine-generating enzyme required for sulfatase activity